MPSPDCGPHTVQIDNVCSGGRTSLSFVLRGAPAAVAIVDYKLSFVAACEVHCANLINRGDIIYWLARNRARDQNELFSLKAPELFKLSGLGLAYKSCNIKCIGVYWV